MVPLRFYLRQLPAWLDGDPVVRQEWAYDAYLLRGWIADRLAWLYWFDWLARPHARCWDCRLPCRRWWRAAGDHTECMPF